MPASSQATVLEPSCANKLDQVVSLYNTGQSELAKSQLDTLVTDCGHLPQVHHNLGVLAFESEDWQQSAKHFNQALANDTRSSMTQSHLQGMHQYRASLAYQSALAVKKRITPPAMQMQDSTLTNTITDVPPHTLLHNVPTVDYELYSWWTAAAEDAVPEWLEHYSHGYPPVKNNDAEQIDWDKVNRDISFTAQDAVVILSYRKDDLEKHVLLLLRLQNNRWKIYRESTL